MPLFGRNKTENFEASPSASAFRRGESIAGRLSYSSNDMTVVTNADSLVDAALASKLPAWAGRTNLIVRQCVKVPLYAREEGTLERLAAQPAWLTKRPMRDMSAQTFKFRIYHGLATRGWCPFKIHSLTADGYPARLSPLPVRYCSLTSDRDGRAEVVFNPVVGQRNAGSQFREWRGVGDDFKADATAWIMRLSDDGSLGGINPVEEAVEAIGLGLAAQVSAGGEFASGGTGSGIIVLKGASESTVAEFTDSMSDKRGDTRERHRVDVTNAEDVEYVQLSGSLGEMQNLEARKLQVSEIARFDGIPPGMLGAEMATWGSGVAAMRNIVHAAVLGFFLDCVESELTMLVPAPVEVVADRRKMLRGSEREEWQMLGQGIRDGLVCPNEARAEIDYGSIDDGDCLMPGPQEKGERGDGTEARMPSETPGDS